MGVEGRAACPGYRSSRWPARRRGFGRGLVQPDESNDRVRFHMFSAAPVALRVHGVLWHMGLELAPVWSLPVSRDPATWWAGRAPGGTPASTRGLVTESGSHSSTSTR